MGFRRIKTNAVMRKLEAGDGSIKGLRVMWSPNHGDQKTILIEMEVIGINFNHYSQNGVAIAVKPVHGSGWTTVSSNEFIDNTPAARALFERAGEAAKFASQNKFTKHSTDKNWRIMVSRERMNLTDDQRAKFDTYTAKKLEGRPIAKASEWELKDVFEQLVRIKFELNELEAECDFYEDDSE